MYRKRVFLFRARRNTTMVEEGERMQGQVKWYNRAKGYGFIEGEEDDFFVHYSHLPEGIILEEGDEVSFEAVQTDKGWQAQNVELVAEE